MSRDQAVQLTIDSLIAHGAAYEHWAIAYSGGKDSSATVSVVCHLIEAEQIPKPKSLTVLYADTRMELPPLQAAAMQMLTELRRRGVATQVVLPDMDHRFMVYMLGRGVPPPSNTFRWCTGQLKVQPMERALVGLYSSAGQKIHRRPDRRERGQGSFQQSMPDCITDTLAPLLHWRSCHVWDWLTGDAPALGFPTFDVADAYGMDVDGSAFEVAARTGCVGCNLASRDLALERLVGRPKWEHLAPLLRLRPLYALLKAPSNRLRKLDERKADGTPVSNPGRLGPLTMDARRMGLAAVLAIQVDVNREGLRRRRPGIDLISPAEHGRILELIEANTWPHRWDGDEITGDTLLPIEFTRRGGRQSTLAVELLGQER
jgi:DNA sulfur modification protein DndC